MINSIYNNFHSKHKYTYNYAYFHDSKKKKKKKYLLKFFILYMATIYPNLNTIKLIIILI